MKNMLNERKTSTDDMVPRSRLYPLAPVGEGTWAIESLTSYINRLAQAYRVSPRVLVAQEIVPHLTGSHHLRSSKHNQSGSFCRRPAISINGAGEIAVDWADTLMRLTMRPGLQNLTLLSWKGGLSTHGLLRRLPVWCSVCYHEWKQKGLPIYQPLLWMLQIITICPQHKKRLEERCPSCLKPQSVITAETQPGFCTQCKIWLGIPSRAVTMGEIDDEDLDRQRWMMRVIEDLYQTDTMWKTLSSDYIQTMVAVCAEAAGGMKRLSLLASIYINTLHDWRSGREKPSLKGLLEFSYSLNISPLQSLTKDSTIMRMTMQGRQRHPLKLRNPATTEVDRKQILAFIQAVLAGQERPMGPRDIERRFGLTRETLVRWFPQECVLINAQYQLYRAECKRQRSERMCEEVREVMLELHAQGIHPSRPRVQGKLSDPNMFRRPEVLTTYHAVRRQLGIET